jgi:hypothetical protein
MKNFNKIIRISVVITVLLTVGCNNSGTKKEDKKAVMTKAAYTPELPVSSDPSDITPIYDNEYFSDEQQYIIYASFEDNNGKISIPVFSTDDELTTYEGEYDGTYVIDIKITSENYDGPFNAMAYFNISLPNQYDSYLIRLFKDDGEPVILSSKNIENENVYSSQADSLTYSATATHTINDVTEQFSDFFGSDSTVFILPAEEVNDSTVKFKIMTLSEFEEEVEYVKYDLSDDYLIIEIKITEDTAAPLEGAKAGFTEFDINRTMYYAADKKKTHVIKRSRRDRKTIARTYNKNRNSKSN